MARATRWAIFTRAFLLALLASQPSRVGGASDAEDAIWRSALEQNTISAYHNYLSLFPAGDYVTDAIAALDRLGGLVAPGARTRQLPPQAQGAKPGGRAPGQGGVY